MNKQDSSEKPKKTLDLIDLLKKPSDFAKSHELTKENLKLFYQLLYNYEFLWTKIQHPEFGIQKMLEDYDLLDLPKVETHPDRNPETVRALELIKEALQPSANDLAEKPTELASILSAKLQCHSDLKEIKHLLQKAEEIKEKNNDPWIKPLSSSSSRSSRRPLRTLLGADNLINVVATNNNGNQVIAGLKDGTLIVWDLEALRTGEPAFATKGRDKSVTAIAITPDNEQVIVGFEDGTVEVQEFYKQYVEDQEKDIHKLRALFTLTEDKEKYAIITLAITSTSEGKWVTIVGKRLLGFWGLWRKSHWVIKWNLGTRETVFSEGFDAGTITLTPDGTKAILWTIKTHGVGSGKIVQEYLYIEIKNLLLEEPSTKVGKVYLDNSRGEPAVTVFALTPNEKQVIFTVGGKNLFVYNLETTEQSTLEGHNEEVTAVAITPDGNYAISSSKDKTLKIWSLETMKVRSTLTGHIDWVTSVTITPDGKKAISISKDGTLRIWDLENLDFNSSN